MKISPLLFLFDMGLPMIFPSLLLMAAALLPIVLIEALFVRRALHTSFRKALPSVFTANLVSTSLGIPVTWILLTALEFASVSALGVLTQGNIWTPLFSVTLGAPWVPPGHNDEQWIIMGAMLFLLIPYGLVSWLVEYKVIQKMQSARRQTVSEIEAEPDRPALHEVKTPRQLIGAVGIANLMSYFLLALIVIAFFAASK